MSAQAQKRIRLSNEARRRVETSRVRSIFLSGTGPLGEGSEDGEGQASGSQRKLLSPCQNQTDYQRRKRRLLVILLLLLPIIFRTKKATEPSCFAPKEAANFCSVNNRSFFAGRKFRPTAGFQYDSLHARSSWEGI